MHLDLSIAVGLPGLARLGHREVHSLALEEHFHESALLEALLALDVVVVLRVVRDHLAHLLMHIAVVEVGVVLQPEGVQLRLRGGLRFFLQVIELGEIGIRSSENALRAQLALRGVQAVADLLVELLHELIGCRASAGVDLHRGCGGGFGGRRVRRRGRFALEHFGFKVSPIESERNRDARLIGL